MAHFLLAAGALRIKTVGLRRRQGAAVPIGTKTVVEPIGLGMTRCIVYRVHHAQLHHTLHT